MESGSSLWCSCFSREATAGSTPAKDTLRMEVALRQPGSPDGQKADGHRGESEADELHPSDALS
jgi:hypothetical protein